MIRKTLPMVLASRLLLTMLLLVFPSGGRIETAAARGATGGPPRATLLWRLPAPDAQGICFSPDGAFLSFRSGNALICIESSTGRQRYKIDSGEADRLMVGPGGRFAVAYSGLNPARERVTFIDESGKAWWERDVSGAVWCADAAATKGGTRFVVGTGRRYVYVFDVGAKRRRSSRWAAPGAVVSISLDPRAQSAVIGTWQDSAVLRLSASGGTHWRNQARRSDLHYVELLHSRDRILHRSMPNRSGRDGRFALLDARGKAIWGGVLSSAQQAEVVVSPNGRFTCLGYTKRIEHKAESARERHAALYDAGGRLLWDKGSLFFRADPLAVESDGWVLVASSDHALFWLNPRGEPEASVKLPAAVRSALRSGDGSRLLLRCADGGLHMLRIHRQR